MTAQLPPNLLQLFAPRPALRFLPAPDYAPEQRKTTHIDGLAGFLGALKETPAPYHPTESWLERKDRERLEHEEAVKRNLTEGLKNCI